MAESDAPLFYRTHVFCCTNRRDPGHKRGCCAEKGAEELRTYMKAQVKALGIAGVRVNSAGCLNRCELGPTMVIYPEGIWYSCKTKEDIDEVIEQHVRRGRRVERLLLPAACPVEE